MANILSHIYGLQNYCEKNEFKGHDPYDALNSPLFRLLCGKSKWMRIAAIQAMKRSPVNMRPLVGIRKDYNPKGLGLILWGYAKLFRTERRQEFLDSIHKIIGLLAALKSPGYSGNCWGYNFDWQSRAFFVPKYTPTIVNSSFIGHALVDTYAYTGLERALDLALTIKDFILKDLNRRKEGGAICFSYTPLDHTAIHNANLLGASLLIRLYRYAGGEELKETALSALSYSMKYQREDGSWHYAETEFQRWIDSFHTGFNLQSISYFLENDVGQEYREAFTKGVRFYKEQFFLDDGTPKYYHNRVYPIDIHSPAQAVVFFSRLGKDYAVFAEKILKWMVEHMQDKRGFFYFQKRPCYTVKIPYMRWAQAWAFHGMTEYWRMVNGA